MNLALKENFTFLYDSSIGIEPVKLSFLRIAPLRILNICMKLVFNTKWAETVISNHALSARSEMRVISNEFIDLANSKGYKLPVFEELVKSI